MAGKYDDIIDTPRRTYGVRRPMPRSARAAQFAPFAALEGYSDAVEESSRYTETRPEAGEDKKAELDAALRLLSAAGGAFIEAEFTYFVKDAKKSGGSCVTLRGRVKRVDPASRRVLLEGGGSIPTDDIVDISFGGR